jgi:molecular chaperone HtpG
MAKKQFKAESKRLLDLMVNSIYTHQGDLPAGDHLQRVRRLRQAVLQGADRPEVGMERKDFHIDLTVDKAARTITVSDNGIGMDKEDLENNLGVIASSGSFQFKKEMGTTPRTPTSSASSAWASTPPSWCPTTSPSAPGSTARRAPGNGSPPAPTATPSPSATSPDVGTDIIMHLKPDTDDEKYSEYLEEWKLQDLMRRYSDYIRFPIRMEVSKTRKKEGSPDDKPEYETYREVETLNSMVPIWQRPKAKVTKEEYDKFYRDKFTDYTDPQSVITVSAEGAVTYKALLFIPGAAPFDFYSKDYEKGLQLYSNGVLIMDKCADLVPDHFRFIRGVVDSPTFSLNISRELLQHDRQLKVIAANLEKKIKAELEKLLKDDRAGYETFWKNFGRQLKYGVVADYGAHKELLQDLLLFWSSTEKKLVTLDEYVSRMKEDQKVIYYAAGENVSAVDRLPQIEGLKDAGVEILYFTEEVDEFAVQMMHAYKDHEFRSALDGDRRRRRRRRRRKPTPPRMPTRPRWIS